MLTGEILLDFFFNFTVFLCIIRYSTQVFKFAFYLLFQVHVLVTSFSVRTTNVSSLIKSVTV